MSVWIKKPLPFMALWLVVSLTASAQEAGYLDEFERPYGFSYEEETRPYASQPDDSGYLAEFERPYGFAYGEEDRPFDSGALDTANNRVIVDGLFLDGTTMLNGGLNTSWGQTGTSSGLLGAGTAIGNQLNVVTNGNNNTVIIDSTQINNGDQMVVLNEELDLTD